MKRKLTLSELTICEQIRHLFSASFSAKNETENRLFCSA